MARRPAVVLPVRRTEPIRRGSLTAPQVRGINNGPPALMPLYTAAASNRCDAVTPSISVNIILSRTLSYPRPRRCTRESVNHASSKRVELTGRGCCCCMVHHLPHHLNHPTIMHHDLNVTSVVRQLVTPPFADVIHTAASNSQSQMSARACNEPISRAVSFILQPRFLSPGRCMDSNTDEENH